MTNGNVEDQIELNSFCERVSWLELDVVYCGGYLNKSLALTAKGQLEPVLWIDAIPKELGRKE